MKTARAIFTQGLSSQYKLHLSQRSQNSLFELSLSERSHFRITLGFQNMLAECPACQPAMALPCAWQWQAAESSCQQHSWFKSLLSPSALLL